jgi:hypothetical protein
MNKPPKLCPHLIGKMEDHALICTTCGETIVDANMQEHARIAIDALLFKRHMYTAGESTYQKPEGPTLDHAVRSHKHYTEMTQAIRYLALFLPARERAKVKA